MKKRKFFLTSLPLASGALIAQAVVIYLILLIAAQAQSLFLVRFIFGTQSQSGPEAGYGQVPLLVLLAGVALAISSLVCLVVSFRRREPGRGWRLIPIAMLTAYLGSWVILLR